MVGLPKYCQTKEDWQNAVDYAKEHEVVKPEMRARLIDLRDNYFTKSLKKSAEGKEAEELTASDFEDVENPAAPKFKLGFSDVEINNLLEVLK